MLLRIPTTTTSLLVTKALRVLVKVLTTMEKCLDLVLRIVTPLKITMYRILTTKFIVLT